MKKELWESRLNEMRELESAGITAKEFAIYFSIDRVVAYQVAKEFGINLKAGKPGYQGQNVEPPPHETGGFLIGRIDHLMIPEMEKATGRYVQ